MTHIDLPVQTLPFVLKSRELVEAHIEKHKESWASPPSENEQEPLSSVSVYVRVRPLLAHDLEEGSYSLAAVQAPRTIHFTHPTLRFAGSRFATKTYQADGVFSDSDESASVYQRTGLLTSLKECVSTPAKELYVLAYGQTGTGKTYTTTYIEERITRDLFSQISASESKRAKSVHVSIFEIRGTLAYDLLSSPPFASVKILNASTNDTTYPGLTEHTASDADQLLALVKEAASLRFTRSTTKNNVSSRSHAVVRFRLCFDKEDAATEPPPSSNIFIVDLAGSERGAHITQNDDPGIRKEAIETNKSLAVLKDCIRARLENPNSPAAGAACRGSKLTTVLRRAFDPSAGAESDKRLVVIACVSPSVLDCEDSLNTLNYVTPFKLVGRAALDASSEVVEGSLNSIYLNEVAKWDRKRSIHYFTRNLPKFLPFVDRLLPSPDATITSLFTLSQADLLALLVSSDSTSTSSPSIDQMKALAQAKALLPSYYAKLQKLSSEVTADGKKREVIANGGGPKTKLVGSTKQAALRKGNTAASSLRALTGRDFASNETGPVTKIAYHDMKL